MTNTIRLSVIFATVLLAGRAAIASSDETVEGEIGGRIDAYLSSVEPFGFAGAVLVEQDGVVILRKGYGLADRASGLRITADTRFDLGSIAKQFTAALILRLVEQDTLDLDAPLSTVLPDVPADKASITLRHLLSHSSGLPYHAAIDHSVKGRSLAEVVPIYLAQPLRHEPGARFSYSNPGYALLAAIAERANDTPFPLLLHEQIAMPAKLHATGHVARAGDIGGPWARAYLDELDVGAPPEWPPDPEGYGAGGVVGTVDDLRTWLGALRSGTVLEAESVDEMWRKQIPIGQSAGYGYGWFVATTPRDTAVVFHAGDYQGFNNELRLYRDESRLIVLLSNVRLAGTGVREFAMHNIATIAAGDDVARAPLVVDHDARRLAPRMGAYSTEDGDRFELAAVAGGVRVESVDASLLGWMTTVEAHETAGSTWADRAAAMMQAAAKGDFEPVRRARHRAVVVRGEPTELELLLAALAPDDDAPLTWEIIGSRRAGPVGSGQTFVRVRAGARERLVRLAWMDDAVLAIGESGAAHLDLRPTGPDEFVWFDLFTGRSVRLHFDGETAHLEGGATLTAERL